METGALRALKLGDGTSRWTSQRRRSTTGLTDRKDRAHDQRVFGQDRLDFAAQRVGQLAQHGGGCGLAGEVARAERALQGLADQRIEGEARARGTDHDLAL